jgi:hypothetical protein
MLLAQMGAVHAALMKAAGEVAQAEFLPHKESAIRAVNQLGRTFTAQLECLKRYLSAPVHNVNVSVSEGGQAIVSTMTQAADRAAPATAANVTPAISDARQVPMETIRDQEQITVPLRVPPRNRANVANQPDTEDAKHVDRRTWKSGNDYDCA